MMKMNSSSKLWAGGCVAHGLGMPMDAFIAGLVQCFMQSSCDCPIHPGIRVVREVQLFSMIESAFRAAPTAQSSSYLR